MKRENWTAFGMSSEALGFRISFAVCAALILSGIVLALALPKRPGTNDNAAHAL